MCRRPCPDIKHGKHSSVISTLMYSQDAYKLAKGDKELFIVDGATCMTPYDGREHVALAMGKLSPFFKRTHTW
jgi:hypothetical protein